MSIADPIWRADLPGNQWKHADGRVFGYTPPPTGVDHDAVMGVGGNPATGTGGAGKTHILTSWEARRIYNAGNADRDSAIANGARVIALTAESGTTISKTNATQGAAQLETYLDNFYNGSGSAARQDCEVHWANGNEENRAQAQGGAPLAQNYFDTCVAMNQVILDTVGGIRRFPLASSWIDLTEYGIRVDGHGPTWEPLGPHIQGIAMSMYPPRRQDNPCNFCGDFAGWSPVEARWDLDFFVDPTMDWVESMAVANANITQFATWEIASPVEGTWYAASQTQARYSVRPRYFCGGIDAHGHNHEGVLNRIHARCEAMGVRMREQLWWDENIQYPNNLFWDSEGQISGAPQGMARYWHDWQIGTVLPSAL